MSKQPAPAFTLVELLVVVTIIVVLLSLLTPALDRAIYEAELVICAGNVRAMSVAGVTYAGTNRRAYPKPVRPAAQPNNLQPSQLRGNNGDWRPLLRQLAPLNRALNCPLNADVDYESVPPLTETPMIWADYNLYFAWSYTGQKAMNRVGDRFTSGPDQTPLRVLMMDRDLVMPGRPELQSSHQDEKETMDLVVVQDGPAPWGQTQATISLWQKSGVYKRGAIDQNFGLDDLSVQSVRRVLHDEPRLFKVPIWGDGREFPNAYSQMPAD